VNYRNIIFLFILTIIIIVISSCKKDGDTLPPVVTIDNPYEYKTYNMYDTIYISGNAKDDNVVQSVKISIVNSSFLPVLNGEVHTPNNNLFYFNTSIAINDIHLNSGLYYVLVTATDGTNSKNLYRAITINGIPLQFKKMIAITKVNSNSYNVYGINDTLQSALMFNYTGDYISSAINNNYQQLYVCGSVNSDMNAYDLINNSLQWSLPNENNAPFPSFNNVYFNNDIIYVSYYNNKIIGYNRLEGINMTSHTTTGYTPGKTYIFNNYLLAQEKNTSGTEYALSIYYTTGFLKASNLTSVIIKGMETKDDTHVYLFGNTLANKAVMTIYDVGQNGYYPPHVMPDATLYDYVKIDANDYLLSIGSDVYWYQQNTNSLTSILTNVNAKHICYESLSGNFVITSGNQLSIYNYPSGNYMGGTTLPYTINDILLQYNR